MKFENGLLAFGGLLVASLMTTSGVASGVEVVFDKQIGATLSANAVIVAKAELVNDDGTLRITGRLRRPHRLAMAGHLHAYAYTENTLIADSKHRVPGLNSQRKGEMRILFNILLKDTSGASKVHLEYHSPGHQER